jgi:transposase-like protein
MMPLTPQQKKENIVKLFIAGKDTQQIAEELGLKKSLVGYHVRNYKKENGIPLGTNGPKKAKKAAYERTVMTDELRKQVKNHVIRGLSVSDTAKKLGISMTAVRNAMQKVGLATPRFAKKAGTKKINLGAQATEMRATGMPIREIAEKLNRPLGTIHSALHAYKVKLGQAKAKGAITVNGHHSANGNASLNGNGPTKGELIGLAWAQIERGVTDISERIGITPSVLRKRISELLAYQEVRESNRIHED